MDAGSRSDTGPSAHTIINIPNPHPSHDELPSSSHLSTPDPLPSSNMTDTNGNQAAVANGIRASPSPNIPNGKPTSPYLKDNIAVSPPPQTVSSKDPKAAAAAANDMRNVVRRKLTGYVGFANLPNQWHRKSVRKGFNFNVMVVGTCPKLASCSTVLI